MKGMHFKSEIAQRTLSDLGRVWQVNMPLPPYTFCIEKNPSPGAKIRFRRGARGGVCGECGSLLHGGYLFIKACRCFITFSG